MAEIWLVRHGQASFGEANYDQLSDLGRRQMRMLAEHIRRTGFMPASIVSGDMKRQHDSAEIVSNTLGLDPVGTDSSFNEFAHLPIIKAHAARIAAAAKTPPEWSALRKDRAAFERFFAAATEGWMDGSLAGDEIEPWTGFLERAAEGLRRVVGSSASGEHVVVMTSAGVIAALMKTIMELSDPIALRLSWVILNSSVTRLVHDGSRISLAGFNSIAHLEHAGDESLVTAR